MTYVLSDIHGNERRFHSVMEQIKLQPEDTLWVLGDVIDRHPGGIRILRQIMAMPNGKMLLGNHEYMMLRALGHPYDDYRDDGRAVEHWYRNGGQVTHEAMNALPEPKRQEILEYLHGLPLNMAITVNDKQYLLVHGAPISSYWPQPKYRNPNHYAVWKRLGIYDRAEGDAVMIFGHTPTRHYQDCVPMELWYGEDKIGIDCGSGYPETGPEGKLGRLACLRLEDGQVFYSEEEHSAP